MKIAFLIHDYSPSRGGQERYLARLIGALASGGHDLHIFAARGEAGAEGGFAFHRVPLPALAGPSLSALLFIRGARRMLAAEKWDIVSGLVRFYPLDVYRMGGGVHRVWLREKADTAAGRMVSYTRPFTWLALRLEKQLFDPRRCRRIVANSRLCRGQLLGLYPYPPERVSVIYNGVDHDAFHPRLRAAHREAVRAELGIPGGATAALFVSNNPGRKGLETALRAIAIPQGGRPHLLVAGRGRTERFAALARELGVASRVRFLGHVPDVRPYYGAADYLVLPTRYDPFANVCLEAMACGLPVVTTRANGASEIIEEGKDGFVIADPRDAEALSRPMGALAGGEARARMAEAARVKSLAFTVRANAEATLAVYRQVLEERHGTAR
ncbi:MAG: glycosyltransferase family 4 protein [Chlamydiota bacterium]